MSMDADTAQFTLLTVHFDYKIYYTSAMFENRRERQSNPCRWGKLGEVKSPTAS